MFMTGFPLELRKKQMPSNTSPIDKRRINVHPELLEKIDKILAAMRAISFPMMITDGVRTAEVQHELWRQGRERIGNIVTNADGYNFKSNHQIRDDGFGHAIDCCFLDPNGKPTWSMSYPWKAYSELCMAVGLNHGIKLNSTVIDWPHVELK